MDQRVQKILILMRTDPTRGLTLDEMAKVVNLSPSRLYQVFKTEVGVPPTRYLRQLKMEKARELLETTFLSVKVIVAMIGVNDESHFVRDFKREYSVTPTQYRSQFLSNEFEAKDFANK
jgi:transcriptional regulator GlxA family with amidase domain